MNNAVFWKTMENVSCRVDIQLVNDEYIFFKIVAKPQYEQRKLYCNENDHSVLVAFKQCKREVKLDKPI